MKFRYLTGKEHAINAIIGGRLVTHAEWFGRRAFFFFFFFFSGRYFKLVFFESFLFIYLDIFKAIKREKLFLYIFLGLATSFLWMPDYENLIDALFFLDFGKYLYNLLLLKQVYVPLTNILNVVKALLFHDTCRKSWQWIEIRLWNHTDSNFTLSLQFTNLKQLLLSCLSCILNVTKVLYYIL